MHLLAVIMVQFFTSATTLVWQTRKGMTEHTIQKDYIIKYIFKKRRTKEYCSTNISKHTSGDFRDKKDNI